MYSGKLVFAQLMEHLPLHTFRRCVARYPGNYPALSFSHLDQYLCMVFAQLTYRESLRDIETHLRAHSAKLYYLGIRSGIARSTLADANAKRNWRIHQDFALSLISMARRLYAEDSFGLELKNTAYALDSTTIALDQRAGLRDIGHFASRQYPAQRIAQRIQCGMNLGAQPTLARAPGAFFLATSRVLVGLHHRAVDEQLQLLIKHHQCNTYWPDTGTCIIPERCIVFVSGADEVFGTSILPAMAAHLYPIRRLILLRRGVLQEAQMRRWKRRTRVDLHLVPK